MEQLNVSEEQTEASERGGETIEDMVIGYKVLIFPNRPPRYLFELRRVSPVYKCKWIWPRLPNDHTSTEGVSLLMESVKARKSVIMRIGSPIFPLGHYAVCPVWEITSYFSL